MSTREWQCACSHTSHESVRVAAGASLVAETRSQLARLAFRSPRLELLALAFNASMVFLGWTLLPRGLRDWVFSVQGPLAFAVVLQTWMLGDVISTNVMALHRAELAPLLRTPVALRRYFRARSAALTLIVGATTASVTLVIAAHVHRYLAGITLALAEFATPLYVLGIAMWLGIFFPYHPRSLRWRWANRKPWLRTARWLVLRFIPYSVVAALISAPVAVVLVVAVSVGGRPAPNRLTEVGVAAGAVVVLLLAPLIWFVTTDWSARLAGRRAEALLVYLDNPERG